MSNCLMIGSRLFSRLLLHKGHASLSVKRNVISNVCSKLTKFQSFHNSCVLLNRFQHEVNTSDSVDIISEKPSNNSKVDMPPVSPLRQLTKSVQLFENVAASSPNEQGFTNAVEAFKKRDIKRTRVIDFIDTAMTYMDSFGLAKNVHTYNQLLEVFPKGVYHNKTVFDTLWTPHRRQIDCAVRVLTKLEENHIRPNIDTYDIVDAVFGNNSIPLNKLRRIVFWFDKFDEMYPDPLPIDLPETKEELHKLAIERMKNKSMVNFDARYKTHDGAQQQIIGAKNGNLENLLEERDMKGQIFLEGPHNVWLRKKTVPYYLLKANFLSSCPDEDNILAMCIIEGKETEEILRIWLNEIQTDHPKLSEFNVIFNVRNIVN